MPHSCSNLRTSARELLQAIKQLCNLRASSPIVKNCG
jgi:hypothetical protein